MQTLTSATTAGVKLSLGLIGITVSVHGAVGPDPEASFNTVCVNDHDPAQTRQHKYCPVCEERAKDSTNPEFFKKAKPSEDGEGFIIVSEEALEAAKAAAAPFKKDIHLTVHPAEEVTSVLQYSGKSYYLSMKATDDDSWETYTALGQLIRDRQDLAFMCKFALRTAVSLFRLEVAGEGTLILRQMADAELVREHPPLRLRLLDDVDMLAATRIAEKRLQPFLAHEHGTGKSTIISQFLANATAQPAATVEVKTPAPSTGGKLLSFRAAVAAELAEAAEQAAAVPEPEPAKKRAPRKTAARRPVAKAS